MPNPLLVGWAVYILQKLSGTFTRYVWRPTGILDYLENPPAELEREHPDVFRFVNFFIRLNEGFAYEIDTKEGQIELLSDLAALGVKAHLLRLGVPLIQRLLGAGSARFLTQMGLNLPETLESFGGLLGGNPQKYLEDLIKGYNRASEEIESGKHVVDVGLRAVFESADFTQKLTEFIANPSPLSIPGLIKQGFDTVIAMFDFLGVVVEFIPDPKPDVRYLQERLPRAAAEQAALRWMREEMPSGVVHATGGWDTLNPEHREILSELAKGPKPRGRPSGWRPPAPTLPEGWFGGGAPGAPGPVAAFKRFGVQARRPTSSIAQMLKMGQGMTAAVLEKMKWWLLGGGARGGARGAAGGQPWGGGDGSGGPFPGGDLPR